MADVMKLNVITPEKQFYEGDVTMVELTTTEGNIGVYPNHIPLTAVVAPGVLTIHEEGEKKQASLISGFITILPDSVTIMAEVAEWPDEIDFKRAEEAPGACGTAAEFRGSGAGYAACGDGIEEGPGEA